MGQDFLGSAVYYMTSWYHMKEYCKELYSDGSPFPRSTPKFYDHCALAYSNHRGLHDLIGDHSIFYDYSDEQWQYDLNDYKDKLCDLILVSAFILYLIGYNFKQTTVMSFSF